MADRIIAAWAERHSGPGWSNQMVKYLIWSAGELAIHSIQPDDITGEMWTLLDTSSAAHKSMISAVDAYLHQEDQS